MLEKLLGFDDPASQMAEILMWRWAENHPVLFTVIKISDSALYFIIAYAAYMGITKAFKRSN